MRKRQQKQILDIIQTFHKTNAEIKRLVSRGELSAVLQLMIDCQNGIVKTIKLINLLEGEGTNTVTLLEEYHERLNNFGKNLKTNDTNFVKYLQNRISQIKNSIKKEIKTDKIEIVFFPYKASMWDSLESIWIAANQDLKCDAYVVPIPYYDRLPKGELGQMHYEGDLYPKDIPIVDWRTYDLEKRRPDVIVIHNPYDDGNYVTSVHPDYYSDRLKGFTELLCYVPYFVSYGDVENSFILCSGVLNADRVYLQSEKVRDTYIQVCKEFEQKNRCPGRFGKVEQKFIAMGSPKFDRILNTKRKDCSLPESWDKLIENKKVVIYNTSIGAFLQGGEQYLKKLRFVIDIFRTRDDMALWWRPHPLIDATCQSMRPRLFAEYKKIIAAYRREGWGIYDDTGDLHRALAVSDALIGDVSSLMSMYNVTGKPSMLIDAELEEEPDDKAREEFLHSDTISFMATPDGDPEWGFSMNCNALYKISVKNATAEYIASVPDENNSAGLYRQPIKIGNKLLLAPSAAHAWAFYDISTGEWTKIPVPDKCLPAQDRIGRPGSMFGGVVCCDGYILILPGDRGVFVKYNIESGEFTYYSEWFKRFQPHIKNISWGGIFSGLFGLDGKLFLSSPQCNIITVVEPNNMKFKYLKVGAADNQYFSITYIGDSFWLLKLPVDGQKLPKDSLVEWNSKSGKVTEHNNLPIVQDEQYKGRGITTFIPEGTALYLFPFQSNSIIKFDTEAKQSEIIEITLEYNYFDRKSILYTWSKNIAFPWVSANRFIPYPWPKSIFDKSTIIAQMPYDYSLMKLDLITGEYNLKKWKVSGAEERLAQRDDSFQKDISETGLYRLENFLDDVSSGGLPAVNRERLQYHRGLETNVDGTSGKKIYKNIRECVWRR